MERDGEEGDRLPDFIGDLEKLRRIETVRIVFVISRILLFILRNYMNLER